MIGSSPKLSKSECHSCYFHLFFLYPQKQTAIAKIATEKKNSRKISVCARNAARLMSNLNRTMWQWLLWMNMEFHEKCEQRENHHILLLEFFSGYSDVICGNALQYLLQLNILPFCDAKKWDESVMKSEIRTKNHQLNKWEYIFPYCGWWTIPCGN